MKRKLHLFLGGFAITALLIAAMCGFAAIDLSTDRYMPGRFPALFQLDRVDSGGASLTVSGRSVTLSAEPLRAMEGYAARLLHLLPPEAVWLSRLGGEGATRMAERLSYHENEEEDAW